VQAGRKPGCLERAILETCVLGGDLPVLTRRKVDAVLRLGSCPSMQFGYLTRRSVQGQGHPLELQILEVPFESS